MNVNDFWNNLAVSSESAITSEDMVTLGVIVALLFMVLAITELARWKHNPRTRLGRRTLAQYKAEAETITDVTLLPNGYSQTFAWQRYVHNAARKGDQYDAALQALESIQ